MSDERKQGALDSLRMLAGQRDEIEAEIAKSVAHALNQRATWSEIEKALGYSAAPDNAGTARCSSRSAGGVCVPPMPNDLEPA